MSDPQDFIIPHAQRNAEREAQSIIADVVAVLVKHGVNGAKVQPFGEVGFDILDPSALFDHLEFKITCTGWGRVIGNLQDNTTKE